MKQDRTVTLIAIIVIAAIGIFFIYSMTSTSSGEKEKVVNARITDLNFPEEGIVGGTKKACVTINNTGNTASKFMVEQGIIPDSVASDWGLSVSGFSSYNYGQCCPGMEIIQDKWVTVSPGQQKEVCVDLEVPNEDTQDLCGDTQYWKEATDWYGESYTIYGTVSNHCNYRSRQKVQGYKQYSKRSKDFSVCSGLSCNFGLL